MPAAGAHAATRRLYRWIKDNGNPLFRGGARVTSVVGSGATLTLVLVVKDLVGNATNKTVKVTLKR